ncbi:CitMHS family transporter [Nesterenkonia sp. F]|uniref:CitMHS family transporter n=1 Tax=Nesterenkonia sp. F TaxID=795955 RepID=UPI000255CF9D|nr:SLC13 family permease [Nesterenkonia sp. F]
MLSIVGLAVIVCMTTLLILGRIAPVVGLTVIPITGALIAGFGPGEISEFFDTGLADVADVAVMLIFAILFFGVMNDVGLFNPLIRATVKLTGGNVIAVCVGTVLLGAVCHLDGAGASTYLITLPALLPLYRHLGMSPYLLFLLVSTSMGILNMLPWGGPTGRAASVTGMDPVDLWISLIPVQGVALVLLVAMAVLLGIREKKRLETRALVAADDPELVGAAVGVGSSSGSLDTVDATDAGAVSSDGSAGRDRFTSSNSAITRGVADESAAETPDDGGSSDAGSSDVGNPVDENAARRPLWMNAALVVLVIAALISQVVPPSLAFMVALSGALVLNYPRVSDQMARIRAHGGSALGTGSIIFAAGCFLGIMSESGMLEALASAAIGVLPEALLPQLHLIVGAVGLPLELLFSTDAHYFALLPLVEGIGSDAGVSTLAITQTVIVGNVIGTYLSPFNASMWLGLGLANLDMGKHFRYSFFPMWIFSVLVLAVSLALGLISWS